MKKFISILMYVLGGVLLCFCVEDFVARNYIDAAIDLMIVALAFVCGSLEDRR